MTEWLIGIDEAGRGSLAGPLAFGAVAMRPSTLSLLDGIRDSKKLSLKKRVLWYETLMASEKVTALYGEVASDLIDTHRMGEMLDAGANAIAKRIASLLDAPRDRIFILLDGTLTAPAEFRQMSVIDGDNQLRIVAAASIIAKVKRDRTMRTLHCFYPDYGLNRHKGYGTEAHRWAIREHGPVSVHRRSFRLS